LREHSKFPGTKSIGNRGKIIAAIEYEQSLGGNERAIARQALIAGLPIPAKILNAPMLTAEERFYRAAWEDLSTCRPYRGAYIPWTAINDYALRYEFGDFDLLHDIIMRIDIDIVEKRQRKDNAARRRGRHKAKGGLDHDGKEH
jgi:hypothetical protein